MNLLPNDDENMLKCISPFAADNDLPVKTPADADDGPDQRGPREAGWAP